MGTAGDRSCATEYIMTTISFPAPYPRVDGERKFQSFPSREEAQRMIDFYRSMGVIARLEP
jgi:hypothetical protein